MIVDKKRVTSSLETFKYMGRPKRIRDSSSKGKKIEALVERTTLIHLKNTSSV